MKRIIRLTEKDLTRIVKRVISEQENVDNVKLVHDLAKKLRDLSEKLDESDKDIVENYYSTGSAIYTTLVDLKQIARDMDFKELKDMADDAIGTQMSCGDIYRTHIMNYPYLYSQRNTNEFIKCVKNLKNEIDRLLFFILKNSILYRGYE